MIQDAVECSVQSEEWEKLAHGGHLFRDVGSAMTANMSLAAPFAFPPTRRANILRRASCGSLAVGTSTGSGAIVGLTTAGMLACRWSPATDGENRTDLRAAGGGSAGCGGGTTGS